MTEPNDERELVMAIPFINVRSTGGIYADDAYAAGFETGIVFARIQSALAAGAVALEPFNVRQNNIDQLDLIAMHFGWALDQSSAESLVDRTGDRWITIRLRKSAPIDEL